MTERDRKSARDEDPGDRSIARSRYAVLSDRALVDAIRARDGDAIEELIRRYQPLVILQAIRLRIAAAERKGWVTEVLYQVASTIARGTTAAPRALGPYIVATCKRRLISDVRRRRRRERWELQCASDIEANGQRAVLSVLSEHSVRATYEPGWRPARLPPVLCRLVSTLEASASGEERQLLSLIGQRVPYSLVAEWLGISRAAAIKRVARLRARLTNLTVQFGSTLEPPELAELLRFLRRSGALDDGPLLELDGAETKRGSP